MKVIIDLLLITFIVVMIVDKSGVMSSIKYGISKIVTSGKIMKDDFSIKPFDCSLCMTFWLSLIYLLVNYEITLLYLAITLFNSIVMSSIMGDIISMIQDIWCKIIKYLKK